LSSAPRETQAKKAEAARKIISSFIVECLEMEDL